MGMKALKRRRIMLNVTPMHKKLIKLLKKGKIGAARKVVNANPA